MHCVLASPLEVPRVGGSSERESKKSCLCNHLPELCEQPRLENRACSFGPRTIGWYTYTGETTNSERIIEFRTKFWILVMILVDRKADEPETRVIPDSVTHPHTAHDTGGLERYANIGLPKNYTRRTPRP
jgi:hypothetical protein